MNTIPTQREYETDEARRLTAQLEAVEKAPLEDRREAREDYAKALAAKGLVAERIGWMLQGTYGFGAMQAAKQILARPKMNHTANLGILIAAIEWQCPSKYAAQAWNKQVPEVQAQVTAEIRAEIADFNEQEEA